jgi:hypothetical protein
MSEFEHRASAGTLFDGLGSNVGISRSDFRLQIGNKSEVCTEIAWQIRVVKMGSL